MLLLNIPHRPPSSSTPSPSTPLKSQRTAVAALQDRQLLLPLGVLLQNFLAPGSSTKRFRLELVDKMPENPKRVVFESTQQWYEDRLRQDERLTSSPDPMCSPSEHPVIPTSCNHSPRRTHAAPRLVDRILNKLKTAVF